MRRMIRWIGFIMIVPAFLRAETVTVTEILDANLFQTKDGRLLRLACVRTPSISDEDPSLRRLAVQIKREAEKKFKGYRMKMEIAVMEITGSDTLTIHLWKDYDLSDFSINKWYLESGWGIYIQGEISPHDLGYRKAAEEAFMKHKGVWSGSLFHPSH